MSVNDKKMYHAGTTKTIAGKTQYHLLDFEFLKSMAEHMAIGANKNGRAENDWQDLGWTQEVEDQYIDALLRHALEDFNPVAVACNAMIIAWHIRQQPTGGE